MLIFLSKVSGTWQDATSAHPGSRQPQRNITGRAPFRGRITHHSKRQASKRTVFSGESNCPRERPTTRPITTVKERATVGGDGVPVAVGNERTDPLLPDQRNRSISSTRQIPNENGLVGVETVTDEHGGGGVAGSRPVGTATDAFESLVYPRIATTRQRSIE